MFFFVVYSLIMILVIVGITLIINHYHDRPLYLQRVEMYKKGFINLGTYSKPRWADRAKCPRFPIRSGFLCRLPVHARN